MRVLGMLMLFIMSAVASRAGDWRLLGPAVETMNLHYRVEAGANAVFGIEIGEGDTVSYRRYEAKMPSVMHDDVNNSLRLKISFMTCDSGYFTTDSIKKADIFSDMANRAELSMKIGGTPENALLEIGDRVVTFDAPVDLCDSLPLFVRFFGDKDIKVVRENVYFEPKTVMTFSEFEDMAKLTDYLKGSDDIYEGIWNFYDRTTTPLRAAPNGEYVLATVKNEEGYDIIYIRDNEKLPSSWRPLAIKGKLQKCDIPGVYDVTWYDRGLSEIKSRVIAVIDGNLLTVSFPYYKTSLRFNKLNLKEQKSE